MTQNAWLNSDEDRDWENPDNWTGGVPVDDNDLYFHPDASAGPEVNMDRTGDTAGAGLHLSSILIPEGTDYKVGATGAPLRCTVANIVRHFGSNALHFVSETGTGGVSTGHVVIDSFDMANGSVIAIDDDIGRLDLLSGLVSVTGTGTTNVLTIGNGRANRTYTTIASAVTATKLFVFGGVNTIESGNMLDVVQFGGVTTQTTVLGSPAPGVDIRVFSGLYTYRGGAPVVGDAPNLHAYGGTVYLDKGNEFDGLLQLGNLYTYPAADVVRATLLTITSDDIRI